MVTCYNDYTAPCHGVEWSAQSRGLRLWPSSTRAHSRKSEYVTHIEGTYATERYYIEPTYSHTRTSQYRSPPGHGHYDSKYGNSGRHDVRHLNKQTHVLADPSNRLSKRHQKSVKELKTGHRSNEFASRRSSQSSQSSVSSRSSRSSESSQLSRSSETDSSRESTRSSTKGSWASGDGAWIRRRPR
ncbi:hypothetical protein P153DRAFT_15282 [Dothidotthia symphoricarpi CBS 119687]|uniref:Uncharacterized protein n=1 Tax=Dothidotthia symphoricarpi CBS 119687 TaxID=1392245 RepID=A0A6A6AE17_9PLEO|nr:uncharacterized protein P153DRAFT_15282 [Dothidotthia symphoricarpi CBS 119687]KAF2129208.1 hypothetical protein P153DRAFT_15282 [Dothidotthia symphoricarpi CBS 119687]